MQERVLQNITNTIISKPQFRKKTKNAKTDKMTKSKFPTLKKFGDEFPVFPLIDLEKMDWATKYRPCSEDVFVTTYPKCGTTWMQHIVYLIQHAGCPAVNIGDFFASSPYFEFFGADAVNKLKRPGAFKTHLPFHLIPWSQLSRYIVVIRNPFDTVVSLHYHYLMFCEVFKYNGKFDDTFECFMSENTEYGDYFKWYKNWLEHHKNSQNVLFVTYEALKNNPEEQILQIAKFLGAKYYNKMLEHDHDILKKVIKYSSFEYMKKHYNKNVNDFLQTDVSNLSPDLPEAMRTLHASVGKQEVTYVRKGQIGDWKNHFNSEQMKRLSKKLLSETPQLACLWPDMNFQAMCDN